MTNSIQNCSDLKLFVWIDMVSSTCIYQQKQMQWLYILITHEHRQYKKIQKIKNIQLEQNMQTLENNLLTFNIWCNNSTNYIIQNIWYYNDDCYYNFNKWKHTRLQWSLWLWKTQQQEKKIKTKSSVGDISWLKLMPSHKYILSYFKHIILWIPHYKTINISWKNVWFNIL